MTNVLHTSLSKSFALSICSRDPMKNLALEYFCKITYSQMHQCIASCNHDASLEDNYCVPFFMLKFLTPHYVTYFVRQSLQKFTEKVNSKVPFREISYENIHFCGLKKETLFLMGGKYKWILSKNMLSSSLVDIFFLRKNCRTCAMIIQREILNQSKSIPPDYTF